MNERGSVKRSPVPVGVKAVVAGLRTYLPRPLSPIGRNGLVGGTASARYCYGVWLRHLVQAHRFGLDTSPDVVAELGPGSSIGVGLAALLTGTQGYYALDAVTRFSDDRNRRVHDGLVQLLGARADIPDEREFPKLKPVLSDYAFQASVLTEGRLAGIRRPVPASAITYISPWERIDALPPDSVDWVISQAVLEHVDNLDLVYAALASWVRPGGVMSHQIDFKCHGTAGTWNGHWTYADLTWRLIRGRRPYLINRQPLSTHLRLLEQNGFEVRCVQRVTTPNELKRSQLAPRFRDLDDEDLRTSGGYVLAVKLPPSSGRLSASPSSC
jgi:hypothetical protein